MTATITQTIPAERIKPGKGIQVVNAFNPDGSFMRQVRHYGTEAQARAYVESLATHAAKPTTLRAFSDRVLVRIDPQSARELHLMNHPEKGWDSASQVWTWDEIVRLKGWELGDHYQDEHGGGFWLERA